MISNISNRKSWNVPFKSAVVEAISPQMPHLRYRKTNPDRCWQVNPFCLAVFFFCFLSCHAHMYVLPNLFRFAETANKEQKSLECRPLSIRSVCVLPINLAALASDHWVISWVNPKTGIKATWPHGHMGTLRHKTRSAVATKRGAFQWAGGVACRGANGETRVSDVLCSLHR